MRQDVTDRWWPFTFGCSANEINAMKANKTYHPQDICNNDPKIKKAMESLKDRTFANTEAEHQAFVNLYNKIMDCDRYFVLKDLDSYYKTQLRVEELFQKPNEWAEYAIHNIAGMFRFSVDVSIKNYCEKIWQITPCPADNEVLERIRHEYSILDKCRIF